MENRALIITLIAVICIQTIFNILLALYNKMMTDGLNESESLNKNLKKLANDWKCRYMSLKSFYDLAGDAQIDKLQREIRVLRTMLAQKWEESESKVTSSKTVTVDTTKEEK